jgi:hypothetical protein
MSVVAYNDLFTLGLGFDISGAYLVAKGLTTRPVEYLRRTRAAANSFAAFRVRAAEDFADGRIGVTALVLGFGMQAVGYTLSIAGVAEHTHGDAAAIVAFASTVLAVAFTYCLYRLGRWGLVRKWLLEDARWTRTERHEHPDLQELWLYGKIAGRSRTTRLGPPRTR